MKPRKFVLAAVLVCFGVSSALAGDDVSHGDVSKQVEARKKAESPKAKTEKVKTAKR